MREDLLALTTDALVTLTNRGLVKRAAKEVEAAAPSLVLQADGTLVSTAADDIVTSLPPGGGLDAARCSCGAAGVCRHVLGAVLAYQSASQKKDETTAWSPAAFTDDQLAARLGKRLMSAAQRAARAGYVARVVRPGEADPAPRVELSSCTVRFLVPHDLGFAHTDAVKGTREDVIALAVWAFRVADERHPDAADVQVQVGGSAALPDVEAALSLADEVLRTGAVHAGGGLAGPIGAVQRTLDAAGLRWPLLAVGDIAEQLAAYADRSSRYRPDLLADLVVELHARQRATGLRTRVLGVEESAQTQLRRLRLDGLGCRVGGDENERVAEIFLAHADSATVLVVRRIWPGADPVGGRRIGGASVAALAVGTVVTESAVRSASRTVKLGTGGLAKTTVSPSAGAWDTLPASLVVRDLRAAAAELDALPPRFVRPRVEAELVRVVEIASVRSIGYAPGAQRLDAYFLDSFGAPGVISAVHRAAAPGGLDALATALESGPRFVSGSLSRRAGTVVVDPLAVAVDGRVVAPDLASDPPGVALSATAAGFDDPIDAAVDGAVSVLAEVAHRGLDHLPPTFGPRASAAAAELAGAGLRRAAEAVEEFARTLTVEAWVAAYLRLAVTADLR